MQRHLEALKLTIIQGTGTAVGDPLELGAIAKSISRTRELDDKLFVGSIKSNVRTYTNEMDRH
jgi:hypothetical protein